MNMRKTRTLAMKRSRGMHICHFEGFRQKSLPGGVQDGGGVSGSCGSSRRPISERLPLIVRRRVMNAGWYADVDRYCYRSEWLGVRRR